MANTDCQRSNLNFEITVLEILNTVYGKQTLLFR